MGQCGHARALGLGGLDTGLGRAGQPRRRDDILGRGRQDQRGYGRCRRLARRRTGRDRRQVRDEGRKSRRQADRKGSCPSRRQTS